MLLIRAKIKGWMNISDDHHHSSAKAKEIPAQLLDSWCLKNGTTWPSCFFISNSPMIISHIPPPTHTDTTTHHRWSGNSLNCLAMTIFCWEKRKNIKKEEAYGGGVPIRGIHSSSTCSISPCPILFHPWDGRSRSN